MHQDLAGSPPAISVKAHLLGTELHASSNVLNRKGTAADDHNVVAANLLVIESIADAIHLVGMR